MEKLETAIIEMKSDLKHIKGTTDEIKEAVFGNGHRGLKTRMTIVEITVTGLVAIVTVALYCLIRSALG